MATTQEPKDVDGNKNDPPAIEDILDAMLKENTGQHFLDSGGAYGRNWERNQARDFEEESSTKVSIEGDWISVYFRLYAFLKTYLDVDGISEGFQHDLETFAKENEDLWGMSLMEQWVEARKFHRVMWGNTYNSENILDQDFLYMVFNLEENELEGDNVFAMISVHGGCDIRGGYSDPHIFRLDDGHQFLSGMSDISARCSKCGMGWYSDDAGSNWYNDGNGGNYNQGQLSEPSKEDLAFNVKPDESNQKAHHKNCGGQIDFWVHDHY